MCIRDRLIGSQQLPETFNTFNSSRLSQSLLCLASMWASRNNTKVALADIPMLTYRKIIANSFSLRELQNMFDTIAIEHGHMMIDRLSLYETAVRCFPDAFLFFSDKYMTAVVDRLRETFGEINNAKIKKLLLFCGCGQTKSLRHYIERENYKYTIENCLRIPRRYETLLRRETVDMLIEKVAILETIMNPRLSNEANLLSIQQDSLDWIKDEVTIELGVDKIDMRIMLFRDLLQKYLKEKEKKEKVGHDKRITELKGKILNAPPII
eukprot:TRINITY_DN20667_c0_g1_i2.p1 TRINITY_DN20667_c0_g1~~TRINITY_DN20667_c0_g1_i2.p1  ORF type:complete len:267 (-),score=26.51 TRINITY_DN20667_c0_g1_i2:43-843(-)